MDLILLLKVLAFIVGIIGIYVVARNLDIIKIILVYWKDLIFRE